MKFFKQIFTLVFEAIFFSSPKAPNPFTTCWLHITGILSFLPSHKVCMDLGDHLNDCGCLHVCAASLSPTMLGELCWSKSINVYRCLWLKVQMIRPSVLPPLDHRVYIVMLTIKFRLIRCIFIISKVIICNMNTLWIFRTCYRYSEHAIDIQGKWHIRHILMVLIRYPTNRSYTNISFVEIMFWNVYF